jgi:very-short-patch-repair endonuclease
MNKRVCIHCGKEFYSTYNKPRRAEKYCSSKCYHTHVKIREPFYSVQTPCKCGCGGFIMNPDTHYRYRNFIPGHVNKGGTNHNIGRIQSIGEKEKRIESMAKHFNSGKYTCLERQLYQFLELHGFEYIKQKQFSYTIPDAFIPSLNLVIYADGRYYHEKPEVADRDSRIDSTIKESGFNLIRLKSIDLGYILDLKPLCDYIRYSGSHA